MADTKVIDTTPAIDTGIVAAARRKLVKAARGTGEVIQGYADALCMVYHVRGDNGAIVTPWYELRGKDAKGVKAERAAFVADMTEAGFNKGTVDVYWQRVKEASGYVTAGNRVKGASDTDGKTAAELKTIINRILKAEENGEDCHASTILETLKGAYLVLTGESFDAGK